MCGLAGMFGEGWRRQQLEAMARVLRHRGPDDEGYWFSSDGRVGLGHTRLKVIDLSDAARQPMADAHGRCHLMLNGEIYNYRELRAELDPHFVFRSMSDTEVLLAAYLRWGRACLDKLIGMFAFVVWDEDNRTLFAARDRFGVKPLYFSQPGGRSLWLASEIKAFHAAGLAKRPDRRAWATYLAHGRHEHDDRTFWEGVRPLPPGHWLSWRDGDLRLGRWYDVAERVGDEVDRRPLETVAAECQALVQESLRLRFRADVPVGVNLSGGVDSSLLLGCLEALSGPFADVKAFTFVTGDPRYDELPWVRQMLARTRHPSIVCPLAVEEVPELARSVHAGQDEPYGGLPTLAYARLFERAVEAGVTVLLDGQGLDEQWAGYDYYRQRGGDSHVIQGAKVSPLKPECLTPALLAEARPFESPQPFADRLRNLQYRDIRFAKLPRALRFNDRISMRASRELREPFLDHRLVELALRQPRAHKIQDGLGKWLLRRIAGNVAPNGVTEAPKRPLQTPQREWLQGPLRPWVESRLALIRRQGADWLRPDVVEAAWRDYCRGRADNSFFVWQWLSVAFMLEDL